MGNAEASKARILAAALTEFASYGLAGARVDRIAAAAGCNKNLIYVYFQNKDTLFTTVLEANLTRVYNEIEFTPEDLAGFAGRVFDFAMSHDELLRLLAWNNLEGQPDGISVREAAHAKKVAALSSEASDDRLPGWFLSTTVMAMATAWSAAGPFRSSLSRAQLHAIREHVIAAVMLLEPR
jgi:AcrR family transcriptional regulator